MQNSIDIINNKYDHLEFKIVSRNENILVKIILILLGIIFPISILFIDKLDICWEYFITLLIFGGVNVFWIRLYLWQFYGKECFCIKKNVFYHYFDYKLFKDNYKKNNFSKISLGYSLKHYPYNIFKGMTNKNYQDSNVNIVFIIDKHQIISNLEICYNDYAKLYKIIVKK